MAESEGLSWPGLGTIARMVGRGVMLRCPNCGGKQVIKNWFHLHEFCPKCGITPTTFRVSFFRASYFVTALTRTPDHASDFP